MDNTSVSLLANSQYQHMITFNLQTWRNFYWSVGTKVIDKKWNNVKLRQSHIVWTSGRWNYQNAGLWHGRALFASHIVLKIICPTSGSHKGGRSFGVHYWQPSYIWVLLGWWKMNSIGLILCHVLQYWLQYHKHCFCDCRKKIILKNQTQMNLTVERLLLFQLSHFVTHG